MRVQGGIETTSPQAQCGFKDCPNHEPRDHKQDGKEQVESKNASVEKKRRNNRKERKPIEESTKSGVEQRGKAPDAHGFNCPICDKSFRLESALGQHRTMKHAYTENVTEEAKVATKVPTQPEVASTLPGMKKGKENGDAAKTKAAATQRNAGEAAGEKVMYCEPCNRSFGSKFALNAHQRTKHGPLNNAKRTAKPNYHCDMCENKPRRGYYNQHALEKHQHQKHDVPMPVRPWPCEACDRSFDTDSQLQHHERSQHRVNRQKEALSAELTSSGVPKEEKTEDITEDKVAEAQQDAEEALKNNPLHCIVCDKTFRGKHGFDQHQHDKHGIIKPTHNAKKEKEAVSEEQTEDATENKVTQTRKEVREASKHNPLHCRACNKTFSSTRGFDEHQRTKHKKKNSQRDERPVNRDYGISCDICGQKRFLTGCSRRTSTPYTQERHPHEQAEESG